VTQANASKLNKSSRALRIVTIACLCAGLSWFVLPYFAEKRQLRELGYLRRSDAFVQEFIRNRIKSGDAPDRVFLVLRNGARVRYYLQRTANDEVDLVQRFDYSILWGGPDIYVVYPSAQAAKKVVVDIFTDGFSTSHSELIEDSTAYRILKWAPTNGR
jgi:hypothetical protein